MKRLFIINPKSGKKNNATELEQTIKTQFDSADIVFNTFIPYELSIMKVYALPLLYKVQADDPEYLTALRLIKLLDLVLPLPSEDIPSLSIIREFIGKGFFE